MLFSIVLFVLVTFSYHAGKRDELSFAEKTLIEAVAGLQNGVTSSARWVADFWTGYFFLVDLRDENRKLHLALEGMRAKVNELREAGLANERLRKFLNFQAIQERPTVGAQVVAWDTSAWFKTVTIDKGSSHFVQEGMPVVTDLGIVGRVIGVSPHYARVLLLIDYNSSIDALVQRNRVRGVLAGRSEKTCTLKYVLKNDTVMPGDIIVTSGMGGVFPKGLPLGTVKRVRKIGHDIFQEVDVDPAVDFSRLEEVMVVLTDRPPF